jgi:hypothetical protein
MKTEYRFICFQQYQPDQWGCYNRKSKDGLGVVFWYKPWKQWCFTPDTKTVFSTDCLADIIHFIGQLPKGGPVA